MLCFVIMLQPTARYFHGSVSTDQYMVTMGGYNADGGMETSIFIYRYACNHWTNITSVIQSGA
jgi:hypothetical protein